MSAYCKQCSIELFGEDCRNFYMLTTPEETEAKVFSTVQCSGCGETQVNHEGECVSPNCSKHHGATDV